MCSYFMKKYKYSRPALLLGFILGWMFEKNLFISVDIYGAWFLLRPIVVAILFLVVLVVAYDYIKVGFLKLAGLFRGEK